MRRSACGWWAFVLALTVGCANPAGPRPPSTEELTLAPGQERELDGANTSLRFVGVLGDSRCPVDVVCVLGGDALVHVQVLIRGRATVLGTHDFHTGDPQPFRYHGLTIELRQLTPFPFSSRTIQPDEYRATFLVRQ